MTTTMIGFLIEYRWPDWVDEDWISFPLWLGYGGPMEAHDLVRTMILAAEKEAPARIRDSTGNVWEFNREMVTGIVAWGVSESIVL